MDFMLLVFIHQPSLHKKTELIICSSHVIQMLERKKTASYYIDLISYPKKPCHIFLKYDVQFRQVT